MKEDYNYDFYKKSADYIKTKINFNPEVAIILGSALGSLAEEIKNPVVLDYKEIPNFLLSTVASHAGKLILGQLGGKNIVCMSGRFHYYEGYEFEQLALPIRLFSLLGVKTAIITNAAGGVNTAYKPGDIMIINDHIKLMGASPMRGKNIEEFGERFFDITQMYTPRLIPLVLREALKVGLSAHQGVYYFCPGPQFETPAEIKAIRLLGGDAVGMSTVTEALTAAHCKMDVIGISLISNMAAGVLNQPITSEEVDRAGEATAPKLRKLITNIVACL